MKKLLIALLVIVVLIVGGLVAAPFLIPLDTYKRQIAQQVEAATGRTLMIDGPVDLQLLPTIAVAAGDVRLANAEGAGEADMIRLEALEVELKVWPLLRGAVEIDRFVLQEPAIHLEVDQDGRGNWEFSPPGGEAPPSEAGEQPGTDDQTADSGGGLPLSELRLGDIRIEDGTVTFTDRGSGTSERLDDVDLSVSLPDLKSRLAAEGSFRYKDETVALNLGVEQPLQLTQGGNSPVAATINSDPVAFAFRGLLDTGRAQQARGTIELEVASIRSLAAWLGQPLEFEGDGLEQLEIAGKLDATPTLISLADAAITLDDITAQGSASADLGGAVPMLEGRLEVGEVDLNRYLPPPPPAEEGGGAAPGGDRPAGEEGDQREAGEAAGWSNEPIPIPKLDMAEVDFELSLNGLKVRELELGPTVLAVALHDAVLAADLKEFALYGGRGSGTLEVDTGAAEPVIKQTFRLEGLQALPFLTAAADFERLEGTVNADLEVATQGRSERQLVRNLAGQGEVLFEDGAVVGINLAQMVRNIGAAFTGGGGEVEKTDFAELGGSFTIERGVLSNDDLRLQAPVLRLGGSGRINLPKRTINYRIEPKAAATLEGQGGDQEVAGILVPVVIKGPWEDPKIEPDLTAALGSAGESAEAVKQQLKQLEGQKDQLEGAAKNLKQQLEEAQGGDVKGLVEGVTGALGGQKQDGKKQGGQKQGGQKEGKKGQQQEPADPAQQLLKGLLGN